MVSAFASAQVPDLMNALDAGGRAMGVGGSTQATDSNTLSSFYNPAGLAYITGPTLSAAFRNIPQSDNIVSGKFKTPDFNTSRGVGPRKLTHFGFATPIKGGVVALSYTMGGAVKDFRFGNNLTDGALSIRNYTEVFQTQTDFFTLAYGKRSGTSNFGFGLVLANQYLSDQASWDTFDANNTQIGTTVVSNSGNSSGVGAIAGIQFQSGKNGNSMVGISVRTPIKLSNNSQTNPYLNKVPGRASIGMATRTEPIGQGKDFLVYGAQLDYFFGSDKGGSLARKDVLGGGVGLEYNLHRNNARIPIRVGYAVVPKGSDQTLNRNTFTFGLGYRPEDSNYSVDFNFGMPSGGGGLDLGVGLTYKLGK